MSALAGLSRRERQIMDILYRSGKASTAGVLEAMPDPPSYSAVRAMLRVLEEKGHVRHQAEGLKYVYVPTVARDKAKRSAVKHLLEHVLHGCAGASSGGLAGCLRDPAHAGGAGPHVGHDRKGQAGGQVDGYRIFRNRAERHGRSGRGMVGGAGIAPALGRIAASGVDRLRGGAHRPARSLGGAARLARAGRSAGFADAEHHVPGE